MWLRKATGGSGVAGYYWTNDGDVVEVPDHIAEDILGRPGHDFSYVDPPEPDDPEGPGVDVNGDGVPEGNAVQILAWVGDDKERAAAALAAEHARDKPRSTLASALEKLATA